MKNLQLNQMVKLLESEQVQSVESTFSEGAENISSLIAMLDKVEIREEELQMEMQKAKQVKSLINEKLGEIRKQINARLNG
ncbi:MAG TPA: hypothetical protein PKD70_11145 [Saprospiraceae bacterium]|nr:hypothetical protein [Saprospiraceae bacterium]HMP14427.1 hypothetical protein [Saprospiraceae bacterium]